MQAEDALNFHKLVQKLQDDKTGIPMKSPLVGFRRLNKCFTPKDAIAWVAKNIEFFQDSSNDEIIYFLQLVMDRKYIFNSQEKGNNDFEEVSKSLFRFREVSPATAIGIRICH